MTKADVLDAFGELNVCTAYQVNGETTEEVPFQMSRLKIAPVLQSFEGWKTDITGIKNYNDLPEKMRQYVGFINKYLGVKIAYISNGPGRDQLIEDISGKG
jgi:adenylosuccinate synthase